MPHTKNKWVIVFLIYADFRKGAGDSPIDYFSMTAQMKATLNQMFKDILTVPLPSKGVRMHVLMNSLDYKTAGEPGTQSKTLLYTLNNLQGTGCNQIRCKVIDSKDVTTGEDNGAHPVQNPELLKIILKENIQVHEDEEVFLVTWDHGSAFGIFRETATDEAAVHEPVYANLEPYPHLAAFWHTAMEEDAALKQVVEDQIIQQPVPLLQIGHAVYRVKEAEMMTSLVTGPDIKQQQTIPLLDAQEDDEDDRPLFLYQDADGKYEILKGEPEGLGFAPEKTVELQAEDVREILHNRELAETIDYWLSGKPVSVLVMMNCWMMNLHTMYALQGKVGCLVAPQGDIGTPGYNYKNILRYLFKPENPSPQELAVRCVTSAENKRMRKLSKKLRSDGKDKVDCWKIFAVDLQSTEEGETVLNKRLGELETIIDLLLTEERLPDETVCFYRAMRQVAYDFSMEDIKDTNLVCMVDIVNWLRIFFDLDTMLPLHQTLPVEKAALKAIKKFLTAITSAKSQPFVLSKTNGGKVYENAGPAIGYPPTGYGLFFPQHKVTNVGLIANVKEDLLLQKVSFPWKQFIKAVYPKEVWKEIF